MNYTHSYPTHFPTPTSLILALDVMKTIGISGPSCSGKTCLARHLRTVLPNSFLLYEDDFYLPDTQLPKDSNGEPDWDVPQSFDLAKLRLKILEIQQAAKLPEYQRTREEENSPSDNLLTQSEINSLRLKCTDEPVLIVEGIYLFHTDSPLTELFDYRYILEADFHTLQSRRNKRTGYLTAEGYWQDPPNYFEKHVWPRFGKYSSWLYTNDFHNTSSKAREMGIAIVKYGSMFDMIKSLEVYK